MPRHCRPNRAATTPLQSSSGLESTCTMCRAARPTCPGGTSQARHALRTLPHRLRTHCCLESARRNHLLEVIAEKTGYPTEMLELDMALDADLGIDSIKRVEILSALQERLPQAPSSSPNTSAPCTTSATSPPSSPDRTAADPLSLPRRTHARCPRWARERDIGPSCWR